MEILENKAGWRKAFRENWLKKLDEEGVVDWSLYRHPRNAQSPGVPGIQLADSRLLLVTSAGAYLKLSQPPFDAHNLHGDYSLRTFPISSGFSELAYAHGHYDQSMIEQDAQVGLPVRHLNDLIKAKKLGGLAKNVVSFMGYQPDSAQVADELAPEVVRIALRENVQAALLAPV